MAHSALHFSLGMSLGTLIAMPRLFRAWRASLKMSTPLARWFLLSFSLGTLAVLPGLLRRMGLPDSLCDGWWMNVCVFYPFLNKLKSGGDILGLAGISFLFAIQYGVLIATLVRARNRRNQGMLEGSS